MGLLTSGSRQTEKLGLILDKYHIPLSILCYIGGIVWFCLLSDPRFNAGTYFSENALLTGVVDNEFSSFYNPSQLKSQLKAEVKKDEDKKIPAEWLYDRLSDLGLDTAVQNFTFSYPLEPENEMHQRNEWKGKNVYGILRAPKSASFEAFVLLVPWRAEEESTITSIALLIKMADMMRHKSYWAKDIVFLFAEYDSVGVQAWLDAYHDVKTTEFIQPSFLNYRSGSIQAALNVEILSEKFSTINFILEGINGQMPNLDLMNALALLCRQRGIRIALQGRRDKKISPNSWKFTLGTLVRAVWAQASGVANAAHAPFLKFGIPSLTMRSQGSGRSTNSDIMDIGFILEGICRSLNNLLERFHQSFFFYILPNTDRYISIGLYMPPLGILALPILMRALVLWTRAKDANFSPIVPPIVLSIIMGLLSLFAPDHLVRVARAIRLPAPEALGWGTFSLHMAAVLLPYMLTRKAKKGKGDFWDSNLLQSIALIVFAVSTSAICVLNASLGAIILIFSVPGVLIASPSKSWLFYILKTILLIFTCPLSILIWNILIRAYITGQELSIEKVWLQSQNVITMGIVASEWFGSWGWKVVAGLFFPLWILFWSCLNSPDRFVQIEEKEEKKSEEKKEK